MAYATNRNFANPPIRLNINTRSGSVVFSNRELSTATFETTAMEAIQEFAEAMLAAIEEQSR